MRRSGVRSSSSPPHTKAAFVREPASGLGSTSLTRDSTPLMMKSQSLAARSDTGLQVSAVKPIDLTMGAHLAVSLFSKSASSAGVLDSDSRPKVARPSITSLEANAVFRAVFTLLTMSADALGGRKKANHSLWVGSRKPCSAKVGASGMKRLRLAPEVASTRTLPLMRCCVMSPIGPLTAAICAPHHVLQGRLCAAVRCVIEISCEQGSEKSWGRCSVSR